MTATQRAVAVVAGHDPAELPEVEPARNEVDHLAAAGRRFMTRCPRCGKALLCYGPVEDPRTWFDTLSRRHAEGCSWVPSPVRREE